MSVFKEIPPYLNGFKVIRDLGTSLCGKRRFVLAECKVCGKHFDVEKFSLLKKSRKGCGCSMRYPHRRNLQQSNIPRLLRSSYNSMMARCYFPTHLTYKNYGGKGITVCDEWKKDNNAFFKWALENGYKKGLTLDRINPDLGYFPGNCRFVTMAVNIQSRKSITKLNPEKVKLLRKDFDLMTTRDVAKKWALSHHHVIDIKLRRSWNNIQDE